MIRKLCFAALTLVGSALSVCLLAPVALFVLTVAAQAVEVVAAPAATSLGLPWGDWLVGALQVMAPAAVTVLAGAATAGIYKVAPWASLFLSQRRIEATIQTGVDYGINAVEGAAKGQVLTVPIGSAVVAKAVQRIADSTAPKIIAKAGGLPEIAARVFRSLNLVPEATAANTLAPALDAIPAK